MRLFRGVNPFNKSSIIYNVDFTLQRVNESRDNNSSSKERVIDIQDFVGSEPQMMQRATENLVLLEDISAMQNSLFVIYTQETLDELTKGMRIFEINREMKYRLMAYYKHIDGVDLIVSELSN